VRGLIVLVLATGVWLGWLVHTVRIQREAVNVIQEAGGTVRYNWEANNGTMIREGIPNTLKVLVDFIGVDFFGHVAEVRLSPKKATDTVLVHVGHLSRLKRLKIAGAWFNRSHPELNRTQSSVSNTSLGPSISIALRSVPPAWRN
jgi:hypothetical protein